MCRHLGPRRWDTSAKAPDVKDVNQKQRVIVNKADKTQYLFLIVMMIMVRMKNNRNEALSIKIYHTKLLKTFNPLPPAEWSIQVDSFFDDFNFEFRKYLYEVKHC